MVAGRVVEFKPVYLPDTLFKIKNLRKNLVGESLLGLDPSPDWKLVIATGTSLYESSNLSYIYSSYNFIS